MSLLVSVVLISPSSGIDSGFHSVLSVPPTTTLLVLDRWCKIYVRTIRVSTSTAFHLYSHTGLVEPIASITYPSPPLEASSENIAPLTIQYHPFPSADRLAGSDVEETLRILAFGYRARFIQDTARLALQKADETTKGSGSVSGYLDSLRNMTYAEAREELRQFPGVGPKVAE